jgi:hypothetical protein
MKAFHGRLIMFRPLLFLLCLLSLLSAITGTDPASASTHDANSCAVSPHVKGHPPGGPIGNDDWYANADRTIWATFWGWDFVRRGPDERDPTRDQKVLWYKPSDSLLRVTGRRIDGKSPPPGYDISHDPRPRGPIQPSGIYFPTAGCWEIDAKAGGAELHLVVLVKPGS